MHAYALVHLWSARAKHAVLMRISSYTLPRRAAYFSDSPTRPPLLVYPWPRWPMCALLKTRNQLYLSLPPDKSGSVT